MQKKSETYFQKFEEDISSYSLPERFTFPFYYTPHPLATMAARQLQEYLTAQNDFEHNFGLENPSDSKAIGKMFGVLVVQNVSGELGFISAFSGKLANANHHKLFVPPVFDILDEKGFFLKIEKELNALNEEIKNLEQADNLKELFLELKENKLQSEQEIGDFKKEIKKNKQKRKLERLALTTTNDKEEKLEYLRKTSVAEQFRLKKIKKNWGKQLGHIQEKIDTKLNVVKTLKEKRKKKSALLQQQLFESYSFLNAKGNVADLLEVFDIFNQIPPAGAGECAAPKLLQYAYENKLNPICMAEFWWGKAPLSEIKKHKNFYPACRGKCEPILTHMLNGLSVDANPMLNQSGATAELTVLYEDEYLLVIDKPSGFLSVPGKNIKDSVYLRIKERYPEADGPLLVHRLDMSTSGVLLIAKSEYIYVKLQQQFIKRSIKKRYIAVLAGKLENNSGKIDLPLRVDLNDRPRQLVCYDYGKKATTQWKRVKSTNSETMVAFYPITGRTHQLRVHAAHVSGLNTPIKGDDLYGKKAKRLFLHAQKLEFVHPITKKKVIVSAPLPALFEI